MPFGLAIGSTMGMMLSNLGFKQRLSINLIRTILILFAKK
jgi:hypothetical protein